MNIIDKIKNFFKRIKRIETRSLEESNEILQKEYVKQEFLEDLQKNTRNYFNKNKILEEIEKNPDLIYSLSYKRLVQLNSLYEEKISELEERLENS